MNMLKQLESLIGKEHFTEANTAVDFSKSQASQPQADAHRITELHIDLVA